MASETGDLMASSTSTEPKPGDEAGGTEPTTGAITSELRCPICLEDVDDKAFIDACFHAFCFACIVQWAEVTNSCPMCKTTFKSVIHNVRANDNYEQFDIKPRPTPSHQEVSLNEARRFRYRTTRHGGRPEQRHTHRRRESRRPAGDERRRAVYSAGLKALPVETGERRGRVRNIWFFRENPASTHRLWPWLNREFRVLLGEDNAEFMIQIVMSLIDKVDLESEAFASHLEPFLHARTSLFMHEFISFAKSPYDFIAYDNKVRYDWPTNMLPPGPSRPPPRDSWDPEATQNVRQSSSPGPSGLTSMQQRILDELALTRWDDSPPLFTTDSPIIELDSDSGSPGRSSETIAVDGSPVHGSITAVAGIVHDVGDRGTASSGEQLELQTVATDQSTSVSSRSPICVDQPSAHSRQSSLRTAESISTTEMTIPAVARERASAERGNSLQPRDVEVPSATQSPHGLKPSLPSNTDISSPEVTSTTRDLSPSSARAGCLGLNTAVSSSLCVTVALPAVTKPVQSPASETGGLPEDYSTLSLFPESSGDMDLESASTVALRSQKGKSVVGKNGRKHKGKKESGGIHRHHHHHRRHHKHHRRHHSGGRSPRHYHHHRRRRPSSPSSSEEDRRSSRKRSREKHTRRRGHEKQLLSPEKHHCSDHDRERTDRHSRSPSSKRDRQPHRSRLYSDDIPQRPPVHSVVTVVSTEKCTESQCGQQLHKLAPGFSRGLDQPETSRGTESPYHSDPKPRALRESKSHPRCKQLKGQTALGTAARTERDSATTQLSQELADLEKEIRDNKQQLLKCLLRQEKLELLQRGLQGHSEQDAASTFDQQYFLSESEPSAITSAEDIVTELELLDQAIKNGKQAILQVALRLEEGSPDRDDPDPTSRRMS